MRIDLETLAWQAAYSARRVATRRKLDDGYAAFVVEERTGAERELRRRLCVPPGDVRLALPIGADFTVPTNYETTRA